MLCDSLLHGHVISLLHGHVISLLHGYVIVCYMVMWEFVTWSCE